LKDGVLLFDEGREFTLQPLVVVAVAAHHARAHGIGEPPFRGGVGIGLAYLRVVGQTEVVVKAPDDLLPAPEIHPAADGTIQLGEGEVTVGPLTMLSDRSVVLYESFENISHCI
jgi:hypothetical protein